MVDKICTECKKKKALHFYWKEAKGKDGRSSKCKECVYKKAVKFRRKQRKQTPWNYYWDMARGRCCKKGAYAGKRKIIITREELKKIWFRDKAWLLERPSLDREDNDKDYTYDNCRFIELRENLRLGGTLVKKRKTKEVVNHYQNIKIRKWRSIAEAGRFYGKRPSSIGNVCRKRNRTLDGYVWEYAECGGEAK